VDSENAFLHWGDVLGRTKPTETTHTAELASALHGFGHTIIDWSSFGLLPQEAPVMIADKRKLFFSVLFFH